MDNEQISPSQVTAARALLGATQAEVAKSAGVGLSTIADFERGARTPIPNNRAAIIRALEARGIEFLADGVRLKTGKKGR